MGTKFFSCENMPRTRSQRNVDGSKGNEQSDPQHPRQEPIPENEGTELSRIPPEQLVQSVAANLPTFEAIVNYLKGQSGAHPVQEHKARRANRTGRSESRTGSPSLRPKRAQKEFTREQVEVLEPSQKNF